MKRQAPRTRGGISSDETIERLWTQFRHACPLSADGKILEPWTTPRAGSGGRRAPRWEAGTDADEILKRLSARHSKGDDWLRFFFDGLTPYQRKGGGLHPDAPAVPRGLRPRAGCERGCGLVTCADCYEIDTAAILERLADNAALLPVIASYARLLQIAELATGAENDALATALPAWPAYLAEAQALFALFMGPLSRDLPGEALHALLAARTSTDERKDTQHGAERP